MCKLVLVVKNGVVSEVIADSEDVKVLVLDADDGDGADSLEIDGRNYAIDTLAQGTPVVDRTRVASLYRGFSEKIASSPATPEREKLQEMIAPHQPQPALPQADFPFTLRVAEYDGPHIGFDHGEMWIYDPYSTECGRWTTTPESYGLTEQQGEYLRALNTLVEAATYKAVDAGCLAIQEALGETDGGWAGIYFSGDAGDPVKLVLAKYLLFQMHGMPDNSDENDALQESAGTS